MPKQHKLGRPKQSPTINAAVRDFVLDGQARQFTPSTLEHYRGRLGAFARWSAEQDNPPATVGEVTPRLLRAYLVHLQERSLASNTQHTHARALRAFFNFCKREGWLEESPFETVKMPRPDRVEKPAFSETDVRRLLRACDTTRERALLCVLFDTGARASEVCNLNVRDFDPDAGALTIRQGKGRKDRQTYVGARTVQAVSRYLTERNDPAQDAPLFPSESPHNYDGRLTRSGLRNVLKVVATQARVDGVHPHRFRRTFAMMCLRQGMNVYVLAALMGHSDISILRHYLALVEKDLQKAHHDAGPVDRLLK